MERLQPDLKQYLRKYGMGRSTVLLVGDQQSLECFQKSIAEHESLKLAELRYELSRIDGPEFSQLIDHNELS